MMEQITTTNVLLMLLGFLIQVAVTVQNAIKHKDFSIKVWLKQNLFNGLIGLCCGFALLIMAKDSIQILGASAPDGAPLYMVHAFVSGYAGREMIFRVLEMFKKK